MPAPAAVIPQQQLIKGTWRIPGFPALLLAVLAASGCASNPSPGQSDAAAMARIDNQSAFGMDIYLRRETGSGRLGFAPELQVTRFALTPPLIAGSASLRFEARPVHGGSPRVSEVFAVHPGDTLTWVIPPP
jgi:hypothetical protein